MRKGFKKDENDHTFFHLYVNEKDVGIFTKISHGEKEIGTPLAKRMQQQLKLQSSGNFRDLVQCPLSFDEYLALLRRSGDLD